MIHKSNKKKIYIRPELETSLMECDQLMDASTVVPDAPWDEAKKSVIWFDDEDNADNSWGMYLGCDFENEE